MIIDTIPFVGVGCAGGMIRAFNTKPFTWYNFIIKIVTGGFIGFIIGHILLALGYSVNIVNAICGILGVISYDLFAAIEMYLFKTVSSDVIVPINEETETIIEKINNAKK